MPSVQVLLNPVAGVGKPETTATNGKHVLRDGWPEECDVQIDNVHEEGT